MTDQNNAAQAANKEIDAIMEQAQVFASAWAFYGGPFDQGVGKEQAEREEARLRDVIRDALSKLRTEGVQAGEPVADSMIARVDAAMVEMKNIHPPLRRSDCERLIRAALASAPVAGEAQRIFLVPTGEVYCGQETYTRHEGQPPVNTDNECLYVAPQASAAVRNAAQEVVLSALDPAIAFHLIDRYAENWTHTGVLMERWARAWVQANPETTAKEQARTSDTMSTSHP